MAKAKSDASNHIFSKPKTTAIGNGRHSRPERKGKKKYRGQGKR
tara:strand:+ start:265 stop:396 length:132 start_codon:yes stop_codon:yes gene_type:complete